MIILKLDFGKNENMRVGPFGIWEMLIVFGIILLLFGARKLPEIGSSLGRGIRTFKTAVTGEDEKGEQESQTAGKLTDRDDL